MDPRFANSAAVLQRDLEAGPAAAVLDDQPFRATTLTIVATNVALDKTSLTKLAMMVNTGAARAIHPYHTQGDGDQVIAISTNRLKRDVSLTAVGSAAGPEAAADAIRRGVRAGRHARPVMRTPVCSRRSGCFQAGGSSSR